MNNKAQWKRNPSTERLELYVCEDGRWKNYRSSAVYVKDDPMGSMSGLDTFRACLKAGYIILDVEGNPI